MNMNKPFNLRKPKKENVREPIKITSSTPHRYHIIMAQTVVDIFNSRGCDYKDVLKLELTRKLSEELYNFVEFNIDRKYGQAVMTAKLRVFLPEEF